MNHLLKAMGFWIWGLVAIGLSLSVVSSYRMLSGYRSHDLTAQSRSEAGSKIEFAPLTKQAPAGPQTDVDASRRLAIAAREAVEARNAAQANQDALNSLEAAESKTPPMTHDSKSIQESAGYSNISLDKFKAMQAEYEAALARGAYREEELVRVFRALFQLAAALQQPAKAIDYGEKANTLAHIMHHRQICWLAFGK